MDEKGNIVQSTEIDLQNLSSLAKRIESANQKGAKQHVIGELPKQGGFVEINGLSYKIEFADYVKGRYTIKLVLR